VQNALLSPQSLPFIHAIREWFLLHLSGKFVSSFYDPLNKIILGKWPVMGRGQFRESWQLWTVFGIFLLQGST
jgi:hypothetical protein